MFVCFEYLCVICGYPDRRKYPLHLLVYTVSWCLFVKEDGIIWIRASCEHGPWPNDYLIELISNSWGETSIRDASLRGGIPPKEQGYFDLLQGPSVKFKICHHLRGWGCVSYMNTQALLLRLFTYIYIHTFTKRIHKEGMNSRESSEESRCMRWYCRKYPALCDIVYRRTCVWVMVFGSPCPPPLLGLPKKLVSLFVIVCVRCGKEGKDRRWKASLRLIFSVFWASIVEDDDDVHIQLG